MDYKKNNMNTDREKGRGGIRARVTRGPRKPQHGKRKHCFASKLENST
jgi:hypothetical protein